MLVLVGPTAVGKTAAAVALAQELGGEVLTADSMQIYRGMDIGTAKPTIAEKQGVPHHLIDLVNPDEEFTVADYVARADALIAEVAARGAVPIIAGGTGLYINALLDRWEFPPHPTDMTFRRTLTEEAERSGPEVIHARLAEIDPASAARLHPNDVHRTVRALEVHHLTGRPLSNFTWKPATDGPYAPQIFGLTIARDILHERLATRIHQQLDAGLEAEVRRLVDAGYGPELTSMKGITYRQFGGYLRDVYDYDTAVELSIRDSRRYARRQYTWFNADPRVQWVDCLRTIRLATLAHGLRTLIRRIKGLGRF